MNVSQINNVNIVFHRPNKRRGMTCYIQYDLTKNDGVVERVTRVYIREISKHTSYKIGDKKVKYSKLPAGGTMAFPVKEEPGFISGSLALKKEKILLSEKTNHPYPFKTRDKVARPQAALPSAEQTQQAIENLRSDVRTLIQAMNAISRKVDANHEAVNAEREELQAQLAETNARMGELMEMLQLIEVV